VNDNDEVTRRLRAAVHAEAASVEPDGQAGLAAIRARGRAARRRRRALLAGAGVAAALLVAVAVPALDEPEQRTVTTGPDATEPTTPPSTADRPSEGTEPGPTGTDDPAATTPGTGGTDGEGAPTAPGPGTTAPTAPTAPGDGGGADAFSQPPLWPFRTADEVDAWREQYATSGTQPWHLDAEQTALAFTTGFLGFADVNQVVSSDIGADDAHVTVGYALPEGGVAPAANVHLVRFGTGPDAPWEVVGTEDDRLTLDRPAYGSAATSPLTVGGVVTGVDESLRVQVRQPSSEAPLGEACCQPAGGEGAPWEATVSFSGATDPALTVVVSTGGHVTDVEAFAITAIRR
jgi:hypothetical protein